VDLETFQNLDSDVKARLIQLMKPRISPYCPHYPTPKQQAFLWLNCLDAGYGGAAGGGKSDALLMAALQYVDQPRYNAVLIRDSYANLSKPGGLLDRAHEWLQNTDAHWSGDKKYVFPLIKPLSTAIGATLSFSYLDGPLDHFNHQSSEYQFVGIDEAVNIRENQALYMFSRLRRLQGSKIPIRFRVASNPPTAEQSARGAWVKRRYVSAESRENRVFIPSSLHDNPYLDADDYIKQLNQLDPVTRAQLLEGDWDISVKGRMFDRTWFPVVDQAPADAVRIRYWDQAATERLTPTKGVSWTAGVKMSVTTTGLYFIEDVRRFQKSPLETKMITKNTAEQDGRSVGVWIEETPGLGKVVIDDYVRLLAGFVCTGDKVTGSKRQRAMPFASMAEAGNIYLVNGAWNKDFLDELEVFPDGDNDDQVDAASGAFDKLVGGAGVNVRWL
jgi:predicted phage terminase large subunit-like protein